MTSLRRRRTRTMGRRRKGQALLEFSLVAPLFFMVVLVACQLFVWAYDHQEASRAVRIGATGGNEAMASVNFRFSADPHLATIYIPSIDNSLGAGKGIFSDLPAPAAACRKAAAVKVNHLGWDWGCLYNIDSGFPAATGQASTIAFDYAAALRTPLDASLEAAYSELGELWVGPLRGGTISACYAIWDTSASPPAPKCVLERTASFKTRLTDPISPDWGITTASANPADTANPSFLIVSMSIIPLDFGGTNAFTINAKTIEVLNRFITSCSAPVDASSYAPGTCGSVF